MEENVKENQKKIAELEGKINKLDKDKYTNKDFKAETKRNNAKYYATDLEGKLCPFVGKTLAVSKVSNLICVKRMRVLADKELKQMNTVPERSTNYAQNYKKEHSTNKFDVEVPLEEFDNAPVKVDISEEIHHLISVDPCFYP